MKLINADCLEALKEFDDNSVDYVLTSPPYNISRTKNDKNNKYDFYKDQIENYYDWSIKIIDELLRITKNHIFWNIQANYYNKKDVFKIIGHYADKIQQNIIWHKTNAAPSSQKYYLTNAIEYIICFTNQKYIKSNKIFLKNYVETSVNPKKVKGHNAVMNIQVADFIIKNFTQEKEIILDPFMGTGTTGVSCLKLNRKFIGIEIAKEYYDFSVDRINNTQTGLF